MSILNLAMTTTSNLICLNGKSDKPPVVLIHAGAGDEDTDKKLKQKRGLENIRIAQIVFKSLLKGLSAVDAAALATLELENSPYSNAGIGSELQSDGQARLSASLMDGTNNKFSAVALVTNMHQPTLLTKELQKHRNSSLGPYGAQLLARELGIKKSSPLTEHAIKSWKDGLKLKKIKPAKGTVGAVVIDMQGRLAASTSTGGSGSTDFPERMSDVSTIAGNYASEFAAISCTGVGEQIIRDALAARLEVRVRDGMNICDASQKIDSDTQELERKYGWIAVDSNLNWSINYFSEQMVAAVMHAGLDEPAMMTSRV